MSFGSLELSIKTLYSLYRRQARRIVGRVPVTRRRKTYSTDTELKALYDSVLSQYFPERTDLANYTVNWSSRRQRRTLGSCNIIRRHISIAIELKDPEYAIWLEPLMYHEMCHAVIGLEVSKSSGKRQWHGAEFKNLEARNPRTKELDQWMKRGGFGAAVRRHRARLAAQARHSAKFKRAESKRTGSKRNAT